MAKSRQSGRVRAATRRTRQRRQRQLAVLLIVVAVAILVVATLILLSQKSALQAPEVGDYSSFPQGQEADGSPYIGEADAPVVLTEYSDFACPHCADFAETAHRLIDTYVADGTLKIVYKPMSFVDPQSSPTAAAAGLCAAEQGMFWEMHDALFGTQRTYGSSAFTQSGLSDLASQIGLDGASYSACMRNNDTHQTVRSILADAQALGVSGTPTLMINGEFLEPGDLPYDYLESLILDVVPAS